MKINGKKIEGANIEIVVLPRGNGDDLVFKAAAVLDSSDFDKLCPRPITPSIMKKGGVTVQNVEDPVFKQSLLNYGKLRMSWMILQSLRATEGLEWEIVDYSDPGTWNLYEKELRDAGLVEMEITRLITAVMTANALNDEKINEARDRFLAGQQAQSLEQSSLKAELNSTQSGEPAKESE